MEAVQPICMDDVIELTKAAEWALSNIDRVCSPTSIRVFIVFVMNIATVKQVAMRAALVNEELHALVALEKMTFDD